MITNYCPQIDKQIDRYTSIERIQNYLKINKISGLGPCFYVCREIIEFKQYLIHRWAEIGVKSGNDVCITVKIQGHRRLNPFKAETVVYLPRDLSILYLYTSVSWYTVRVGIIINKL